jgi:hypothetical protein
MLYEEHRQATHERLQRLMREAEMQRLAREARGHYRRRRLALAEALLLRRRRGAHA